MKKSKSVLVLVIFGILLIANCILVRLVSDVRDYAKLINYVGLVRGTSQRVVKLETNGLHNDEMIVYVDGILDELVTGQGQYGLVLADSKDYQAQLNSLYDQWRLVKSGIDHMRSGQDAREVLTSSEKMFQLADSTVGAIEDYSRFKSLQAGVLVLCTLLACAAAFGMAAYHYIRKFFILQKERDELEDKAGRDALTGLYTSERFRTSVEQRIADRPDKKYALIYVDFENFKYVNDVFGYDFGDKLLVEYARSVLKSLKEDELAGRTEADHFVTFRSYHDKQDLLERQQAMDSSFLNCGLVVSSKHLMTIACGICCAEDLLETPAASMMMDRAIFAQKTIKNNPGSHYAFYDEEIRRCLFTEISIRDRMREALQQNEFIFYVQPKVATSDRMVKSAEALVRWHIPGQGLIQPGVFIPVLEKQHFISLVDQHVFQQVCCWLHKRLAEGFPVVPISVNVSRLQFFNPDFVETYAAIKDSFHIPDGLLEIEFTETVAFGNLEFVTDVITQFHRHGFLCSLDDFGSGYSSLGMLKDLSFDVLKLDGSFFRASANIEKERTIVESMVRMVKSLKIITVAEGVELKEQADFLAAIGCDLIQGYYFYKPMAPEDFDRILVSEQPPQKKIMN